MSETLCLQWNEFKENVVSAFEDLRKLDDFSDVTLACGDGETKAAHKVVLAASSPVLQNILRQNKHSHPVIFLRSVKSADLVAILDFFYKGEAKVLSENLESFLIVADELKVKGLAGKISRGTLEKEAVEEIEEDKKLEGLAGQRGCGFLQRYPVEMVEIQENERGKGNALSKALNESISDENPNETNNETPLTPATFSSEDLYKRVSSFVEKTSNKDDARKSIYKCKACGRETTRWNDMRNHIEAMHLDDVVFPCKHCGKILNSRNMVAVHIHRNHKKRQVHI